MNMALVISGFPGVGKSYFAKNDRRRVLDSDSSLFSWGSKGVRNPDFPNNYIRHIKSKKTEDIILVSSHKVVRVALTDNNIPFILVYPSISLKDEYITRFKSRGSDEGFIELLSINWNSWIEELQNQECFDSIVLKRGEYLSTHFKRFYGYSCVYPKPIW